MNTVYVIGVTAAALTLALLAVPPTDLTLARDKNEPVIRAPHDVPALPARDDAAPPRNSRRITRPKNSTAPWCGSRPGRFCLA